MFCKANTTIRDNASKSTHYKLELAALDRGTERVSRKLIGFTCINGGIGGGGGDFLSFFFVFRYKWNRSTTAHLSHRDSSLARAFRLCAPRSLGCDVAHLTRYD